MRNEIYHYGIKRRSGRYPYGFGNRPFQDRENRTVKEEIVDVKRTSDQGKRYSIKNTRGGVVSEAKIYDYKIPGFDWVLMADVDTLPSQRRKGYASKIIDKIYDDVRNDGKGLYLFVKDNNKTAIDLYKKKDFQTIKNYKLRDGKYLIMVKGDADKKQFDEMNFS